MNLFNKIIDIILTIIINLVIIIFLSKNGFLILGLYKEYILLRISILIIIYAIYAIYVLYISIKTEYYKFLQKNDHQNIIIERFFKILHSNTLLPLVAFFILDRLDIVKLDNLTFYIFYILILISVIGILIMEHKSILIFKLCCKKLEIA